MKVLKFSMEYTKLNDPVFTTIRRRCNFFNGELIQIKTPFQNFKGIILNVQHIKFKEIDNSLLYYDTDPYTRNYDQVINLFNSFYIKPIDPDEKVFIILIKKWGS